MQTSTTPDSEPALKIAGGYAGAATAIFALLEAFGFGMTEAQKAAVIGIIPIVLLVAAAVHIRARVFSPAAVAKLTGGVVGGTLATVNPSGGTKTA